MNILEEINNIRRQEPGNKLLLWLALGVVVVITTAILLLVIIWKPKNETGRNSEKKIETNNSIGNYNRISFSEDDQIKEYVEDIMMYLSTENIDQIYNMTSEEYLKYFELDKAELKKRLVEKGILSNVVYSDKYEVINLGKSKLIRINVLSHKSGAIDEKINIIEYSPNNYKIAFDRFVYNDIKEKEYIREGLNFVVYNQVMFDNLYKISLSIENNTEDNVVLNSKQEHEIFYLDTDSGIEYKPTVSMLYGNITPINPSSSMNFTLSFNVTDTTMNSISSIIVKNVLLEKTDITTDIELTL